MHNFSQYSSCQIDSFGLVFPVIFLLLRSTNICFVALGFIIAHFPFHLFSKAWFAVRHWTAAFPTHNRFVVFKYQAPHGISAKCLLFCLNKKNKHIPLFPHVVLNEVPLRRPIQWNAQNSGEDIIYIIYTNYALCLAHLKVQRLNPSPT